MNKITNNQIKDQIIDEYILHIKSSLKNHLKKVILYGSRARGDNHNWSDYDFRIIVDKKNNSIVNTVKQAGADIYSKYDLIATGKVWTENEWTDKIKYPLGMNINKEGIEYAL